MTTQPKETPPMTDTEQHVPLTEKDFADGAAHVHRGIPIIENDDGDTIYAWGHRDKAEFAAAVNDYVQTMLGEDLIEDDLIDENDVTHTHAIVTAPPPDWWVQWSSPGQVFTAETPGAFPLTITHR